MVITNCVKNKTSKEKKNTNQEQSKDGPLKELQVKSGAMEALASSADKSHPLCAFSSNREKLKNTIQIKNFLTLTICECLKSHLTKMF